MNGNSAPRPGHVAGQQHAQVLTPAVQMAFRERTAGNGHAEV